MKKLIFAFLFLIVLPLSAQLKFTIDTDKNEYQYGEEIKIFCKLINISDTTISFRNGSYQSCQAEFSLNSFNSSDYIICLPLVEEIIIPPKTSRVYQWTIDPYRLGIPDIEGEQKLVGYFHDNDVGSFVDSTIFIAPKFLGGQLLVSYYTENETAIDSIKENLGVEVLDSSTFEDKQSETWQLIGNSLEETKTIIDESGLFLYTDYNRNMLYDRIFKQHIPSQFYPLQIGNKWLYKTNFFDVGTTPHVSYHLKEVVGDTLMSNGFEYFVIKYGGRTYFERFDTRTNEIKRYEDWGCNKIDNPIYSLDYVPGDTLDRTYCDEISYFVTYDESFGPDSGIIRLEKDYLVIEEVGFRKHLGLLYESTLELSYSNTSLIGAEIDGKVWGTLTALDDSENLEHEFELSQNYPNPFNPSTTIKFSIQNSQFAMLKVFDILGREIKTIINKQMQPGTYEVIFDASDLPSGIYFYRLTNGNYSATKKMLLMK